MWVFSSSVFILHASLTFRMLGLGKVSFYRKLMAHPCHTAGK